MKRGAPTIKHEGSEAEQDLLQHFRRLTEVHGGRVRRSSGS